LNATVEATSTGPELHISGMDAVITGAPFQYIAPCRACGTQLDFYGENGKVELGLTYTDDGEARWYQRHIPGDDPELPLHCDVCGAPGPIPVTCTGAIPVQGRAVGRIVQLKNPAWALLSEIYPQEAQEACDHPDLPAPANAHRPTRTGR
jgi:hypothetical protein